MGNQRGFNDTYWNWGLSPAEQYPSHTQNSIFLTIWLSWMVGEQGIYSKAKWKDGILIEKLDPELQSQKKNQLELWQQLVQTFLVTNKQGFNSKTCDWKTNTFIHTETEVCGKIIILLYLQKDMHYYSDEYTWDSRFWFKYNF